MKFFRSDAAAFSLLAVGLLAMASQVPSAGPASKNIGAAPQTEIGFIEAPLLAPGAPDKQFPQGSRLVRMTVGGQPCSPVNLTPQFFAVANPRISFDGSQVLFSAQTDKDSGWQVWEMAADGSHPRQLTHCLGDCLQAAYLPRNRIVYTAIGGNGPQRSSVLYVSQGNGENAHPITFGPGNFQVETVLHSGRILVSAESPLVAGGEGWGHRALYTIRPDGTGLHLFRQDASAGSVCASAEELEDGTILFVERKGAAGGRVGGELASIPPGSLRRVVMTAPPSVYESTQELQAGTLVVARRNSGPSPASLTFDLYSFDLARRSLGDILYRQSKISSVSPVPFVPHPAPLYYPSILHPEQKTGRMLCLNSYMSAEAAHGRIAGRIAQVRVIALEQGGRERILGNAPVEKDGSFYMTVPSDTPVRFALLDPGGAVLRAQKSWIWTRPGEDRGCLGCHESQALAPENRRPLTLTRSDTPTPVGVPVRRRETPE